MALDLVGLSNVNEYYSQHYLLALFEGDLRDVVARWEQAAVDHPDSEDHRPPPAKLRALASPYFRLRNRMDRLQEPGPRLEAQMEWLAGFFAALGYKPRREWRTVGKDSLRLPILAEVEKGSGAPLLWILPVLAPADEPGQDPLSLGVDPAQFADDPAQNDPQIGGTRPGEELDWDELITRHVFTQDEPPRWVLLASFGQICLIDRTKWPERRYLAFNLQEILDRKDEGTLRAVAALLHKDNICPAEGFALLDTLDENSHRHAYSVSEDLKDAIRECVELLGNEAIRHLRTVSKDAVFSSPDRQLEERLTRGCVRYLYRLLFILYLEARPSLGYLPIKSEEYLEGYSLESLRDLELVPLETDADRDGYFFDHSIRILFKMIFEGRNLGQLGMAYDSTSIRDEFRIAPLKSHLFDPETTRLTDRIRFDAVRFRNHVLQKVVQRLSLGRQGGGRNGRTGRISYAQLGINQLGGVYENLLSYTGFFAKTDLYEVKPAGEDYDPLVHAYFVTETELADYREEERVYEPSRSGEPRRLLKHARGTYVYRLAGRNRDKLASYYTHESLTRCTVKYALKELLKDKTADDILHLTLCEMALGSAAFQNEAVSQLADAYLRLKQKETGKTIGHDEYEREKQRVKMRLADANVFGVDLNPVAVELAEVSLWLNTIYEGAHVPWFGLQLKAGNSLIGSRRQTFPADLLAAKPGRGGESARWTEAVPDRVPWPAQPLPPGTKPKLPERPETTVYHWLVPDAGMSVYSDKVVKELKRDEIKAINAWRKEFGKAFSPADLDTLKKLSAAADGLWARHLEALAKLRAITTDPLPVWPDPPSDQWPTTTQWKDEQYRKNLLHPFSPYRRLKLAMDYWCALWFWPIDRAADLPTRDAFLMEMAVLLGTTPTAPEPSPEQTTLPGLLVEYGGVAQKVEPDLDPNDPAGLINVEDLCKKLPRLGLVAEIANQRRFLHWELEFTDLFARRGGFDLIAGNPPWVKVEWNEGGLLSEKNPAFAIRDLSASAIAGLRREELDKPGALAEYLAEYEEFEGTQNFLNALQNYPLLAGQKANLYKCFITRAWDVSSANGATAFLHPEGVYDDPNGGTLRRALYPRLRFHFQYVNELRPFAEVDHHTKFSINVYHAPQENPNFLHLANLFATSTVDACFDDGGTARLGGIKDDNGRWNTVGHPHRIIHVDRDTLSLFAALYDAEGTPLAEARLPALHAAPLVEVLRKFAAYPRRLADLAAGYMPTQHWNEVLQQQDSTMRRETRFPAGISEWILSGPHFFVGNPCNKTPREVCELNSDYDNLDLEFLPDDYLPRTNYVPDCDPAEYRRRTPVVPWEDRKPVTEFYRYVNREMIGSAAERTLISALIPPGAAHINTCLAYVFSSSEQLILWQGLSQSVPADFRVKTTGMGHANTSLVEQLPLMSSDSVLAHSVITRTLALNCLTTHYAGLWAECWKDEFTKEKWLGDDPRLDPGFWRQLTPAWQRDCALRTDYARRWALVELDVLAARELGLTLEELQTIYRIQFPVLRGYEADTWYDRKGRIIFTNSRGLNGVGLSRPEWNEVKGMKSGTVPQTVTDTTLPAGPVERTIVYEAPFTRCDREQDYATVWAKLDEIEAGRK